MLEKSDKLTAHKHMSVNAHTMYEGQREKVGKSETLSLSHVFMQW